MVMTSAVQDCAAWLYSVLEPDSALRTALGGAGRVYDTSGPQWTAANPGPATFCVYSLLSGLPVPCLGPSRAGEAFIWLVKVIGRDVAYSALAAAVDRIETLLWAADGTRAGWRFRTWDDPAMSLVVRYVEPSEGGPLYRHVGRQWPIVAEVA